MTATGVTEVAGGQRPPAQAAFVSEGTSQYLTFLLGGEQFAVAIIHVKEIIEYGRVAPVPMMPAWIRGVINLRGAVVPVMDLAARFGRPASALTRRTCIVVVEIVTEGERRDVGVVVDAVSAVQDIAARDIEPPPAMGGLIRSDFIRGMGKVDGRFVIILDATRVLSDEGFATSVNAGANEDVP